MGPSVKCFRPLIRSKIRFVASSPGTNVGERFVMPSRVALVGRAENLFDTTIVTRNSGGSIDLGTPRTFWIGLRLK